MKFGPHTPAQWETWRSYVSGDEGEDLAFVLKYVRRDGSFPTQMKWARAPWTRTFCDLGLYLIYQHHIQRTERRHTDQSRIFANVNASALQELALSGFFATEEETKQLNVDRFNDTWGQQSAYCRDLIHYLFRPDPYLRRLRAMHPKLLQAAHEMPLGEWVRSTATTEITSVLGSPLVSLHTFVETVLPTDEDVRGHVHDLRLRRLQTWADLYEKVFTAYGAPIATIWTGRASRSGSRLWREERSYEPRPGQPMSRSMPLYWDRWSSSCSRQFSISLPTRLKRALSEVRSP
ncbi:hypothetical protein [Streptomyces sp. NPDC046197]|uniref:hypothetical protein n=1 Tax=Streptomyces sp. NPDC046197 TaxID=3154337 RepID=UPI0033C26663